MQHFSKAFFNKEQDQCNYVTTVTKLIPFIRIVII